MNLPEDHTVLLQRQTTLPAAASRQRLPLSGLLALAMAAFVTLLTEIMPAGMLSSIAGGLAVSEGAAGQFITAFAAGALMAAIPVTAMTRTVRRKPLLLSAAAILAIVNLTTALSNNLAVSLAARFVAGCAGGVVWSMIVGYAIRMSPRELHGRAIAIAGGGATAALVAGLPLGAALSTLAGWQGAFAVVSAIAVLLMIWIAFAVPDFSGQPREHRESLLVALRRPGVAAIIAVILTYILAHNILYIYIEPFLRTRGLSAQIGLVLMVFGIGSVAGLGAAGVFVDKSLPKLGVCVLLAFLIAAAAWALPRQLAAHLPAVFDYAAAFAWGGAFGAFGVVTQAAASRVSGSSIDEVQSMCTTAWNCAVAGGGAIGGTLLPLIGVEAFPASALPILALSLTVLLLGMNPAINGRGAVSQD
ncbi:MFS transporter [Novosphingobium panipatense]|uniref:MFS transporter n=1 Tax=Novosphingobium panipatense TaxID=428991 RepID=UPI00399FD9B2